MLFFQFFPLLFALLFVVVAFSSCASARTPNPPPFASGSFNGTVLMAGKWLPYYLLNNLELELHIDFAIAMRGRFALMMGAFVNGTAYLNNPPPVGCVSFPGEPFPFPPNLLTANNATFIGFETLHFDDDDDNNNNKSINVDHWALSFPAMDAMWYSDLYFSSDSPTHDIIQVVFIGANPDHSSIIIRFSSWSYSPPPPSSFQLPSYCSK